MSYEHRQQPNTNITSRDWLEYFRKLFSFTDSDIDYNTEADADAQPLNDPFTEPEVISIINSLKSRQKVQDLTV